jgi:alkylation response protein AidB-like acyl-CoA dehydrogenase
VNGDEQLVRERLAKLLAAYDPATTAPPDFWGAQFDHGLAWVRFPEGRGGLGVSPSLQGIVDQTLREANVPTNYFRNPLGVGMAAPTIVAYGTAGQQERWLRTAFTCEEIWCQLFSEPGAGSDLAGLSCRAEPAQDGSGDWIVNGLKTWTTLAHRARWGLLLARTDPTVERHHGITYFVLDMQDPGVEVRPIRQLTGDAEFNEVSIIDARIPDAHRLGPIGEGWRVAITTLMTERVSIGGAVLPRGGGPIAEAVRIWREREDRDPVRRDQLMQLWVEAEATRLTNLRAQQRQHAGIPGPEGSTAKLTFAELNQRIYDFCLDLLGPAGMLYDSYEMRQPEEAGWNEREVHKAFLRSRGNSIEGGTSEILRNILAERVLGLPPDPKPDPKKDH